MKKLLSFLFLILPVLPAFSQDKIEARELLEERVVEKRESRVVNMKVGGIFYGTYYRTLKDGEAGEYSALRLVPDFLYTNGPLEVRLVLEIDQLFGDADDVPGLGGKTEEDVGVEADKQVVEVRNAYVKAAIGASQNITFLAGVNAYDYPLVFFEQIPMVNLKYQLGMGSVEGYYLKVSEDFLNSRTDDAQVYVLDGTLKWDFLRIRPGLFFYQVEANADWGAYRDSTGFIPALNLAMGLDKFSIEATGAYAYGKDKVAEIDYRAFAFDVEARWKPIKWLKTGVFGTYVSGDDPTTATNTSFGQSVILGTNSYRMFLLEDGGSFTTFSNVARTNVSNLNSEDNGYVIAGGFLGVAWEKLTAELQLGYGWLERVSTGEKDLGLEVDVNIGYALVPGAVFYIEFAYLKAGKGFDASENGAADAAEADLADPMYINLGVTFSL
jgi:hypothetical protein